MVGCRLAKAKLLPDTYRQFFHKVLLAAEKPDLTLVGTPWFAVPMT